MADQENSASAAKYASATKYDTCEELQIMCRHDDAGKWFARIRTKDFRDRVPDLKFDPDADPVYFLYLWTSPEFEAETRGLAESQALRWLASELHFTGRT